MVTSKGWVPWRKYLQQHEFEIFSSFLPKSDLKLLEIGGGDGMKSMFFNELDFDIVCTDIEPWKKQFHPVIKVKKNELPFDSNNFDVIFSSNVITDINDKELFFSEINRVLKTDGIILHEVPSSWWSFSTNFWHYLQIPKFILKSVFKNESTIKENSKKNIITSESSSKKSNLKRLFTHSLGSNPSFIHEIFYYRKNSWKKFFTTHNYKISEIKNDTLFFTGYGVFKNKFIHLRHILSIIFPSTYYFKLEK